LETNETKKNAYFLEIKAKTLTNMRCDNMKWRRSKFQGMFNFTYYQTRDVRYSYIQLDTKTSWTVLHPPFELISTLNGGKTKVGWDTSTTYDALGKPDIMKLPSWLQVKLKQYYILWHIR